MNDENNPDRSRVFLRMWRLVVLLRCRPHTLLELADKLSVCKRTIRRDLKALQAVPLPITGRFEPGLTRKGIRAFEPQVWGWDGSSAWPRGEAGPIADLPSSGDRM